AVLVCLFVIYFYSISSFFFFSSRRRHTRSKRDWSSDVCSSDLFTNDIDYIICCTNFFNFFFLYMHRHSNHQALASYKINISISSRSEEHTSELQSRFDLVCRLLLEKKNTNMKNMYLIKKLS